MTKKGKDFTFSKKAMNNAVKDNMEASIQKGVDYKTIRARERFRTPSWYQLQKMKGEEINDNE